MPSRLDLHAEQLSALGHPARLAILRFIVPGGAQGTAAGEVESHVDLPASTLSHHLKWLSSAGLVHSRSEATLLFKRRVRRFEAVDGIHLGRLL